MTHSQTRCDSTDAFLLYQPRRLASVQAIRVAARTGLQSSPGAVCPTTARCRKPRRNDRAAAHAAGAFQISVTRLTRDPMNDGLPTPSQ
jgi:hypothetical protein